MESPAESPPTSRPLTPSEQARIRRERREAKIRAGGADRLNKITGASRDGIPAPVSAVPPPEIGEPDAKVENIISDPPEVDISQHFYEPRVTPRRTAAAQPPPEFAQQEDLLRQMMLGGAMPGQQQMPGQGMPSMADMEKDPMFQMIQSIMSGGGMPNAPPEQQAATEAVESSALFWRLIHTFTMSIVALLLWKSNYKGTISARVSSKAALFDNLSLPDSVPASAWLNHFLDMGGAVPFQLFYLFATFEALLQGSRFFMEGGRLPPDSMLSQLSNMAPEPFRSYLGTAARYSLVIRTLLRDALVLIFILGFVSWLRR